uniref:Uncharacterized protein n=1 Tax=Tanacetum cinerariifolium TaxID=118510 RepID=A0A699INI7_TANCI|nr:hypothetical protein [Tanacetum cinerariifolium]
MFEAHGHSPASANERDMNVVGTVNNVANNITKVGPTPAVNDVVASPTISTSTLGMSNSYDNVTGKPSRKSVNFSTLFTSAGNEVDVAVPVKFIRAISERFANTSYGFFLGKRVAYPVVANCSFRLQNKSSYARVMIELRADVELKDTIVVDMPKLAGLGEAKNLKMSSQTPRGVLIGPKVRFKPAKQVSKKPTANTSGNKKKDVKPAKENVETSSSSTTPIVDKIGKLEKLIIDEKVTLVDGEGKPLKMVDYPGDHDSNDEVESVDNDMAPFQASERVGFWHQ